MEIQLRKNISKGMFSGLGTNPVISKLICSWYAHDYSISIRHIKDRCYLSFRFLPTNFHLNSKGGGIGNETEVFTRFLRSNVSFELFYCLLLSQGSSFPMCLASVLRSIKSLLMWIWTVFSAAHLILRRRWWLSPEHIRASLEFQGCSTVAVKKFEYGCLHTIS